jgi:hypothetical protein
MDGRKSVPKGVGEVDVDAEAEAAIRAVWIILRAHWLVRVRITADAANFAAAETIMVETRLDLATLIMPSTVEWCNRCTGAKRIRDEHPLERRECRSRITSWNLTY